MNYTEQELRLILKFVRTAKIQPHAHALEKVGTVMFSLDTGNDVVAISKDDLVFKLKSAIKETESPIHVHDNFCLNYGKCSE